MKLQEMRERTIDELQEDAASLKKSLFNFRMAKSLHKLEDTSQIAKTRQEIAQVKTIIREKQLSNKEV